MGQDRRLRSRASELLKHSHRGRLVVLISAATIVLTNTIVDGLVGFYVVLGEVETSRAWISVSLGLTAVINMILLFLIWVVFETLARVERESDRMQSFMDNMYRRTP